MIRQNISILFTLREQFEEFNKNPNVEKVVNIRRVLEQITDFQDLLKYILTPPIHHLNNNALSKDIKLHLVDLIQFILERCRINNVNTFLNVYISLLFQVYTDPKFSEVISGHEELKESILQCWKTLINRTMTDVIEEIYTRKYATKLAAGIHACTLIAKFEKAIQLRLSAIDCMMHFLQIHDAADNSDIVFRDQVADVAMLFFPGITSTLHEISNASETQHHSITMMAVRALGRFLLLVMKDSHEPEDISFIIPNNSTESSATVKLPGMSGPSKENLQILLNQPKRTPEWCKQVSEKLVVIFEKLKMLANHPHCRVRRELVCFIDQVLFSCTRNLKPCFGNLFEILITLTEDESEEILSATTDIINKMNEKSDSGDIRSVLDICEESFYSLLTKLPRLMRTSDDSTQLILLKELAGYLKLLKKQRLFQIMTSNAHSSKLLIGLAYTMELDCGNISLINDITITHIEDTYDFPTCNWKQFKFIFDSRIEQKVQLICRLLGESDCFPILVDSIFKFMSCMPQHRKEFTLLLNWMLEAEIKLSIEFYKQIIEQYISPDLWYLPISVSEDLTLAKAQSNVVQCCLLAEGLGIIAERLREDYDEFLMKTLYIIIERAGHENRYLSYTGRQCLQKVAKSQNCDSIAELLQVNVDYVSYFISIKLHRIEINSNVLNVIKVVMENSAIDFLPSLKSIVDNIFLNIRKKTTKENNILYLKVFYIFAIAIKRMTKDDSISEKESEDNQKLRGAKAIIEMLVEYAAAKRDAANFEEDPPETPLDEKEIKEGMEKYHETDEEEKEPELPYYIKIIENIVKNCLHYVPSQETEVSLLAMAILNECLIILSRYENVLLPMVHETWHPLVERFKNENSLIINRSWDLLQTLIRISKDFVRARTLKEILPSIKQFLTKSAKRSLKKDNTSFYEFTQVYKLQRHLLLQLGKMCGYVSLNEENLWIVLSVAQPYLSSLQYPKLQEACITLYEDIIKCNSDIVWVKCLDIWHSSVEPIPDNNFESWYTKVQESKEQNEFVSNLKTIFSMIKAHDLIS